MNAADKFVSIAALMCEPARARMLWNLLDGRAYTAGELSVIADVSPTSASNHLSKLLEAAIIKVDIQGRHRYYALSNADVAWAVEGLANLAGNPSGENGHKEPEKKGVKYCRTCYDHLAGFVAVQMIEALEAKKCLTKSAGIYLVTKKGWQWLQLLNISKEELDNNRRPLTRQCLDWSERRPHLAGQLGAVLLSKMLDRHWFKKIEFSRELMITGKGRKELYELLGIAV